MLKYAPNTAMNLLCTDSHYRGHAMWFDKTSKEWRYRDDNSLVKDHHQERPCGTCDRPLTAEGHDPCIANLPGVINACCGHGHDNEAYVQFENGESIHGTEAVKIQKGCHA